MLYSTEGSSYAKSTLKEWGVMLHILKDRVSTHIIWNPSAWTICSFSLIYLDYYGLWDTYFILWVIIQQNIQFHAQIVPHLAIDCFLGGSGSKDSPAMQETWVWSLGWEDPLEKEMSTHSSVLAWRIPWTEEPGESQKVGHDWVTMLTHMTYPLHCGFLSNFVLSGIIRYSTLIFYI